MPKPSSTRPSSWGETSTSPSPPRRDDPVAEAESVGLFERHGEDAAVAEADHLGADGPAGPRCGSRRNRPWRRPARAIRRSGRPVRRFRLPCAPVQCGSGRRCNGSGQFRLRGSCCRSVSRLASRSVRPRLISSSWASTEASIMPSAERMIRVPGAQSGSGIDLDARGVTAGQRPKRPRRRIADAP